jgi:hypothetical protein
MTSYCAASAVPPFLHKLRDMLDDPTNHSIQVLSWSSDGATIVLLQVL